MKIKIIEIDTEDNSPTQITYPYTLQNVGDNYNPCEQCSNNPKNGGSGICNCILPYMYGSIRVTC